MVKESQVMLIQRHPRDLRSTLKVAHFSQIVAKYRIYSMAPTTNGYDSPIYIVAYFLVRALPIWFLRGKYKQFQCSEKTCAGSLRSHRQRAFPPNCLYSLLLSFMTHYSVYCTFQYSVICFTCSVSLFCILSQPAHLLSVFTEKIHELIKLHLLAPIQFHSFVTLSLFADQAH